MAITWDIENGGQSGGSKVNFTKFPVGVTKIRIIDEAPHVRWTHWLQGYMKSINCPGNGCPICAIRKEQKANGEEYSYNMSRRFAMNIINRETEQVEIMEQGVNFFQDVKDIKEELEEKSKDISSADLKIKRRGKGKDDTSYRIDIENEDELTDNDKKMIENDITNLEEFFKPNTIEQVERIVNGEPWEDVMTNKNTENNETEEEVQIQ